MAPGRRPLLYSCSQHIQMTTHRKYGCQCERCSICSMKWRNFVVQLQILCGDWKNLLSFCAFQIISCAMVNLYPWDIPIGKSHVDLNVWPLRTYTMNMRKPVSEYLVSKYFFWNPTEYQLYEASCHLVGTRPYQHCNWLEKEGYHSAKHRCVQ
jgi:hypothetical protein